MRSQKDLMTIYNNDTAQRQRILDLTEDITGHEETERQLRAAMANKDILLQEISHRVLNSFHLISGLLEVQALKSPDERVRQQLGIAAQRVLSMALVHRRLYETATDIASVNAKTYLTGLCQELRRGFFSGDDNTHRTLSLDSVADLDFPTDRMAFIGLAVSELVTNACKYAYRPDERGAVAVELIRKDNEYLLSVDDAGAGLPFDFDPARSRGLGMSIVNMQVRELGGRLEVDRLPPGTRFTIHIPA